MLLYQVSGQRMVSESRNNTRSASVSVNLKLLIVLIHYMQTCQSENVERSRGGAKCNVSVLCSVYCEGVVRVL